MTRADIFKLLYSPFKKRTLTRMPELPEWMIEQGLTEPVRERAEG
jgi:hypothetical protein